MTARLLLVAIVVGLCLACNCRSHPFDDDDYAFLGHMRRGGDLQLDVSLGEIPVDQDFRISVHCVHRQKRQSFGDCESAFVVLPFDTCVELPEDEQALFWMRPNGAVISAPLTRQSRPDGMQELVGRVGPAGFRVVSDSVEVVERNWILVYLKGALVSITTPRGTQVKVESSGRHIVRMGVGGRDVLSIERNADGNVTSIKGIHDVRDFAFDESGLLRRITVSGTQSAIFDYNLTRMLSRAVIGDQNFAFAWAQAPSQEVWLLGCSAYRIKRVNEDAYNAVITPAGFELSWLHEGTVIMKVFPIGGLKIL